MKKPITARVIIVMLVTFIACGGFYAVLYAVDNRSVRPGPKARNGYLDLNTWSLTDDGFVALTDGWMFYPNEMLTPGTTPTSDGMELSVGQWPEGVQYGTYRMVVRKTQQESQLMLQGGQINSAASIYVNGRLVQRIGMVATTPEMCVSSNEQVMALFDDSSDLMEIVIRVANFGTLPSGIVKVMLLGLPDQVFTAYATRLFVLVFTVMTCAVGGIFALTIYLFQRRNRQHLYFTGIAFFSMITLFLHANSVYTPVIPEGIHWPLSASVVIMQAYCIYKFIVAMNWELKKRGVTEYLIALPIISVLVSVFFPHWRQVALIALYAMAVSVFLYGLSILVRAAIAQKQGSMGYLIGIVAYALFNIIYMLGIAYFEPVWFATPVVYGSFILVAVYAIELNRSYARISAQTLDAKENLERMVNERTAELLAANQRLKSAEAARREMVASISHDLRAPITSIRGHVELLQAGISGAEGERYLELVHNRTITMERLVHDLYLFSSLESKSLVFSFRRVPIVPYLEEVFFNFQGDLQFAKFELTMDAPESDERVEIDSERIIQVFNNLYFNALRYTPEGGTIALKLELSGGEAIISVADSGSGIAPEDLPHVFDRFYKASKARGANEGGSGLGLAIVQGIVEQHGGRVWVQSKPGRGATFFFTLPLLQRGQR